MNGTYFGPQSIDRIMQSSAYKEFERDVEYYLHNSMHQAIAGDFLALTAANGKRSCLKCSGIQGRVL